MYINKMIINKYIASNAKILDLGCIGDNYSFKNKKDNLHIQIKEKYKNIKLTGVDLNEEGIEYLNKKGFNILKKDIQNFNLNETFDLILFGNLIEHLGNMTGALESIKKHMNHNSKLLLWTPNAYCLINFFAILFKGKRKINPGHTMWHSLETLEIILNQHGLKIEKNIFFNSNYNGGFINRFFQFITKGLSFFRSAFSEDIFLEIKLK